MMSLSSNPGGYVQFGTWFIILLMGTGAVSKPGKLFSYDVWRFLSQTKLVDALVQERSGAFDGTQYRGRSHRKGVYCRDQHSLLLPQASSGVC